MKNIEALELTLSPAQMEFLENVLPFDVGFPNWLIVRTRSFDTAGLIQH